ncbi:MAG: hypothetical protein O2997_05910, partial [Proteobacteria bacterium]|nr:hypothetical protein [Pseudomonadota bacterium]
ATASPSRFRDQFQRHGIGLRPGVRLLIWRHLVGANGELIDLQDLPQPDRALAKRLLKKLANERELNPDCCAAASGAHAIVGVFFSIFQRGLLEIKRGKHTKPTKKDYDSDLMPTTMLLCNTIPKNPTKCPRN